MKVMPMQLQSLCLNVNSSIPIDLIGVLVC